VALGNEWRAGVDTLIICTRRWSGGYDEEWLRRIDMTDVVYLTKLDPWHAAHSATTQISVNAALERIQQHNAEHPFDRDHIPAHEVQVFLSHDLVPVMRDATEILRVANPDLLQPEPLPF
jgi:hypothetical protein